MVKRIILLKALILLLLIPGMSLGAGYLDTPDQCFNIDKQNKSQVYLKRVGTCDGKAGRVFVENEPGEKVSMYADGALLGESSVKPFEIVDISSVVDKAAATNVQVQENKYTQNMTAEAQKTKELYDSPQFQEKLKAESDKILKSAFGDQYASYYKDALDNTAATGKLGGDERVYLFLSGSMPISVLRTYVADVARLNDRHVTIVLRGFVNGMDKMGPTIKFVADLLKDDSGCDLTSGTCKMLQANIIVDPLLYRRYGVTSVPTFVYANGINKSNPDMSEGDALNARVGTTFKIAGDASLKYIMGRLASASGSDPLGTLANGL